MPFSLAKTPKSDPLKFVTMEGPGFLPNPDVKFSIPVVLLKLKPILYMN